MAVFKNFASTRTQTVDASAAPTPRTDPTIQPRRSQIKSILPQRGSARTSPPVADRIAPSAATTSWFQLKQKMHESLLEQMNLSIIDQVDTSELRREVNAIVLQNLEDDDISLGSETFNKLINELMDEVLGLGPLEPLLADPTISDILVNGADHVFVERKGLLERIASGFHDEKHLLRIIDKIVSRVGRRIDESQPWVDARLPDGSRVNAIVRPCAIDGPSLSIRKFSADKLTMDKLVTFGALSEEAAIFLEAAVKARLNIVISGGTGSGKTTMLNALSSHIDRNQRIVTIEDAAELQLQQDHVVRLETRPASAEGKGEVSQRLLVRNALRMRPDRIVIGECRGSEAFDMLQAMNTGHDGSMTTIHANTARDALSRLEQMVIMMGSELPMSAVRSQIGAGIHLVVQLNRLADGSRKITSISEITGLEGEAVLMQDIFAFKRRGIAEDGKVLGHFGPTGVRPHTGDLLAAAGYALPAEIFRNPEVAT